MQVKFSELLRVIEKYGRDHRQHLRDPKAFEEDRQTVRAWFEEHGITLLLDE